MSNSFYLYPARYLSVKHLHQGLCQGELFYQTINFHVRFRYEVLTLRCYPSI